VARGRTDDRERRTRGEGLVISNRAGFGKMRFNSWWRPGSVLLVAMSLSGCGLLQTGGRAPPVPPEYAALPDTSVCVVDRGSESGLREISAKVGSSGIVLLVDGAVQPLEVVHPINVIAGYAGREGWLTRGDPITFEGRRFVRYLGERRIGPELLRRVGEYQGILLFAGAQPASPVEALYIPTAPGCIFQGYGREDLVPR
jgi:hypothetical protein